MRRGPLALAVLFCAAAPAAADPGCRPNAKPMARVELFFGATGVGSGAWASFLRREVTPRFPDGLTSLEAQGQWRSPSGRLSREPSRELLIWYVPAPDADDRIEAIREAYKRRFHQQSVLRIDGTDCVSF